MGADIHTFCERKTNHGDWELIPNLQPFNWRFYGMFGFLADVRNSSEVPCISKPRGFPQEVSPEVLSEYNEWGKDWGHNHSWLLSQELFDFDYDIEFEDKRNYSHYTPKNTPVPTKVHQRILKFLILQPIEEPRNNIANLREFLQKEYFDELKKLEEFKVERIIFWFDS